MPYSPTLFIGPAIFKPEAAVRDLHWASVTWLVEFDGHPIDLAAFGTVDYDFADNHGRLYPVTVKNLTPGHHKFHIVLLSNQPLLDPYPDGKYLVEAGAYDYSYDLTVQSPTATAAPAAQ